MTDPMPQALLDTLYESTEIRNGHRVNHARGILLSGRFEANPEAATLSVAPFLQASPTDVLARFSNATSLPNIADNDPRASPRGIAVRLTSASGDVTDLVGHSVNAFPARTPEEFLRFLRALNLKEAQPDVFEKHLRTHEAARRFVLLPKPAPYSFATERFFTLHAVVLVARDGQRTTGRLNIEPAAGSIHLDIEEAAGHSLDFLHRELAERLMAGSMRMNLVLQVAGPSDAVDDISVPWSDERRKIMLGTLVLDRINVDQSEQERLMFDPARLGPGIEPAGDPMLAVRSASYRLSLQRRSNA